jgi:hypothetical protein
LFDPSMVTKSAPLSLNSVVVADRLTF